MYVNGTYYCGFDEIRVQFVKEKTFQLLFADEMESCQTIVTPTKVSKLRFLSQQIKSFLFSKTLDINILNAII